MDQEILYLLEDGVRYTRFQLFKVLGRVDVERSQGLGGQNVEVNIFLILLFECVFSFIKIISSTCLPYSISFCFTILHFHFLYIEPDFLFLKLVES